MQLLLNKVRQAIRDYKLLKKGDKIVVGVSGGPDSVALIYILNILKKEFRLRLHIAHLNHMLRGEESDRDAKYVFNLAKRLNIPLTLKEVDVAKFFKGASPEEAARKVRLNFLFDVAKKFQAKKIVLGHNKNDQAETVLMRILRGTGLLGLTGILRKRSINGFVIIRPLIDVERDDIEKFLRYKRIYPRRDRSNKEDVYFRNKIRHRLLPELRKYNPNINQTLANMAESLANDYDFIIEKSNKVFNSASIRKSKDSLVLSLDRFLKLHESLQNMVFRLAIEMLKGDTRRLTFQHIRELRDLLLNRPQGAIVDLPSNLSATKNKRYISIYKRK